MEDNRSLNDLTYDEFKQAYTYDLLNKYELSNVGRELLINNCIDLSHIFYYVRDAIKVYLALDEYLRLNIDNLGGYEYNSTFYLNSNNVALPIKVSTFNSLSINNKYNFYVDGYQGVVHLQLNKNISLRKAIDDNLDVLSIDINPYNEKIDRLEGVKYYLNNYLYMEESYLLGAQQTTVTTTIWDLRNKAKEFANDRENESNFDEYYIDTRPFDDRQNNSKKPWFVAKKDEVFTVNAYIDKNGEYIYELYDLYGRKDTGKLEGESFYEAYYNFMLEKGFFKRDSRETEYNWRR